MKFSNKTGNRYALTTTSRKTASTCIMLVLGSVAPLPAVAETETELPGLEVVGEVTPEEHRLRDAAPKVNVRRETFSEQPNGPLVNDVIKRLPGVFTGGAPGENKDLRLRGLDKEFSRVEFDGIQLPDGGEKRELNLDRIPTTLVDEVTILRNASAEHEADGLAGRVQIKMREIPIEQQVTIDLAGSQQGNTDGHRGSITYGNRYSEGFGLQGVLSVARDPLTKGNDKFGADGLLKETETEEKPIDHTAAMLDAGFFYGAGEWHVKPIYLKDDESKDKLKTKFQADGVTIKEFEAEEEDKVKKTTGIGLENKHRLSDATRIDTSIGYYRTTEEKDKIKRKLNAAGAEDLAKRETELEGKEDAFWQGSIKLSHDWFAGFDNTLKLGASLRSRERKRTKDKFKNGALQAGNAKDDYRLEEDYAAVFVQNEMRLTKQLTLLPGVRAERVKLASHDGQDNTSGSTQTDVLPSLSTSYRVNERLAFHAAASRALNRPKFDELSPFENETGSEVTIGNPDLKVATATALDVGFDYVTEPFFVGLNLFYRDIEDVIESRATGDTINGKPVFQVQNVGDGWVRGIELEQRWRLASLGVPVLDQFSITANQSFIDSELENANGTKTPFKEQPEFIGNLILDWRHPTSGTGVSLAVNRVTGIDADSVNDGRDAETFVDLKITQVLARGWSAYLLGTNLTDEDRVKRKVNGETERESTGRTIWVGLEGHF